jgi:hypothetical protein
MTMSIELSRIELTGSEGGSSLWRETSAIPYFRSGYVWLAVALVAGLVTGLGAWVPLSGYAGKSAESAPMHLATATATQATDDPAATALEAIAPVEAPPLDGLKIASQSWRRGGLGSNALVTLTLRNSNDYAVKDIEITCAFARRDGSHLTDRTRVLPEAVNGRSRRTFARMHVGFVNINADKARCALVAASHI